ncbi:hypothetical protein [Streptomyces sp. BE147]|uniref:hypothetical protein n=1 Tax=unclassified Streptomyces TaxID=2593676 RepID=UPI002E763669|nr:hypothetical protein [Streptomyces sp. BE147]MEE1738779.1 hypothetical protein [Streptomyces sp. BE147]
MMVSAAAALTALTIPAQAADTVGNGTEAVSCYGSAGSYSAEAGSGPGDNAHWPNRGRWASVAGYCNDINIKTNSTRSVRVCTHNKCHGWVKATKGVWTVIFKNSTPGAEYYLQFDGVSTNSGWIAD